MAGCECGHPGCKGCSLAGVASQIPVTSLL